MLGIHHPTKFVIEAFFLCQPRVEERDFTIFFVYKYMYLC